MPATKDTAKQVLAFYGRQVAKYPGKAIGLIVIVPIAVLTNSYLPPLILANVIGQLSTKHYEAHHLWASFGHEILAYAALVLVGSVIAWRLVDALTWRLEGEVERDVARKVFDHLMKLSADFHANIFSGTLVSQTNKILGGYTRLADTTIYQTYPMLAGLAFSVIILWHRATAFVLILLVFSLIYLVSSYFVTRPSRRIGAEHATYESTQTGYLADAITNVMAIKSFATLDYENRRFTKATDNTRSSLLQLMRANRKQQSYFSLVTGLITGISLGAAVVGVVIFKLNLSTVFLIFSYTSGISSQLFQFSNSTLRNYNRALADAVDMVKTLSLSPEVQDPIEPKEARIKDGVIDFEDVTFTHSGANEAIFENFNLHIQAGEKIGLVGHSGSGKTTFTRLVLRFSDIDSGEILIDGQNIAAVSQDDLRSHIAYVPQEPLLFHRSIAENIAYGRTDAKPAEIQKAAKLAHAHEFIKDLPAGYDTLVGERGVKLSGGQRQRIAIARAMLKDAPILVLDEATSALDSESEKLIQSALWTLMEGRTAVVIAHRLSTIQRMDRIVVLGDGKIVEQGTHKELLARKGLYAKLWTHQSGGFLED